MIIKPSEKRYSLLPFINVVKVSNPLTPEAKKTFEYDWEDFYCLEIGWWKWSLTIEL